MDWTTLKLWPPLFVQVRVVFSANYPVKDLSDKTKWDPWIQAQLKKVQNSFADGINIDIEDPTENGTDQAQLLTQLVEQTYKTFKSANSDYKVSMHETKRGYSA